MRLYSSYGLLGDSVKQLWPVTNLLHVVVSFSYLNLWNAGANFLTVATRYELLAGSRHLKVKIRQNNPAFTACSNHMVCTEKQRAQRPIQVINDTL